MARTNIGDTVLLLEGVNDMGDETYGYEPDFDTSFYDIQSEPQSGFASTNGRRKKMATTRRCIRKKTYLDRYGRPITRCAKFAGSGSTSGSTSGSSTSGLSGRKRSTRRSRSLFGALGQGNLLSQAKPTLITGGLAAAGAWISQSLGRKVGGMLKVSPGSTSESMLVLALGVVLGGLVNKLTKRTDYGTALGVGAVVVTVLNFVGTLTPGMAGLGSGMGVLQAEPAPYAAPAAMPPLAQFPAGASVSNLYTDAGVAALV